MILTWEGTYCPSLRSKSHSSPNDGQYVSSHVKIIELSRWWTVRAFSGQNHRAPQMMDSVCLLRYMRRHVLSIIWGAIWFWPEKKRTIHHLERYMLLTWEDTHCPSSGELYDFDLRRHVLSIIWRAWTVRAFSGQNHRAFQMMDSKCLLRSKLYISPDDGQYVSSHVKIIWFWPEKTRTVHHLGSSMILTWEGPYCPSSGELYDFDLRRHVLSIIWGAEPSQVNIIELPKWWTVRAFSGQNNRAPQMMDNTCVLRSKW
jgi:hypothetical protein